MADRLNELDGKTWYQYSFSIWRGLQKSKEEKQLKHPAIFPTTLVKRIIQIFSKKGESVLDPFMGCGSTILAAALENRKGIGFDLSQEYFDVTKNRIENIGLVQMDPDFIKPEIYHDDARKILEYINKNEIDLCITSPPYWDVLNRNRTADKKNAVNYGDSEKDLGNIEKYEDFLRELTNIFKNVYNAIKPLGFCVIIVMDIRKKNKFYPLHSDLARRMTDIGFSFEDIIIWDRQHEYNNLRPLGYPYAFRVNKIHEYILIFRKAD